MNAVGRAVAQAQIIFKWPSLTVPITLFINAKIKIQLMKMLCLNPDQLIISIVNANFILKLVISLIVYNTLKKTAKVVRFKNWFIISGML